MNMQKNPQAQSDQRSAAPRYLLFAALLAAALGACASAPRTLPPEEGPPGDFASLPPGALVYFSLDVPGSRPLPDLISLGGLRGSSISGLLDRTGSLTAAVYGEGGGRRFFVRALGNYPSFRAGLSFTFSSAWKQVRSGAGRYWRSEKEGLSVLLEPRGAVVSDGEPFSAAPGPEAPVALAELRRGAVLAGWVPDAAGYGAELLTRTLSRFAGGGKIPLQIPAEQLVFGVYKTVDQGETGEPVFEARLRVETPSVSHARALASILSMLRLFMAGGGAGDGSPGGESPLAVFGAALLSGPPVQDGSALVLRAPGLKAGDIALLFTMFSLYSDQN